MKQLKTKNIPLYLQVQQLILNLIKDRTFSPGERLPSEAELSMRLGVSRPTLREALKSLEQDGVILRKHGVGNFISSHTPIMESGLDVLESLDQMAMRRGLKIDLAHLNIIERPATDQEQKTLSFPSETSRDVLDVERVIKIDDEFIAYLKDVVPLTYLKRADLDNLFTSSVLDVFLKIGRPVPAISHAEIEAVNADSQIAELLNIEEGSALLKLTGRLLSQDEKVLDYSLTYFIPGIFKFNIMRRVAT